MFEMTFDMFYQAGYCLEVRGLLKNAGTNAAWDGWAKGAVIGYFNDKNKFAEAIKNLNATDVKAVYVCPNPAPLDLTAIANNRFIAAEKGMGLSDSKVERRFWLIIDIDPDRLPGISSSNEELEFARSIARAILAWLYEKFMVTAPAIYSGNGIHILIPVDFPNDDKHNALCSDFAKYIKSLFEEDGVTIDHQTANISRSTKVIGTWVRKGEDIETRPHRKVSLAREGNRINLLTAEQMAEYRVETPVVSTDDIDAGEADQEHWTAHRLMGEYVAKAANGNRNKTGLDLACALRDQRYTIDVARDMLTRYQAAVPGDDYTLSEAMASVDQAYAKEPRAPRKAPKNKQKVDEEDFDGPVPTVEEIQEALGISPADDGIEDGGPQARYSFPYLGTKDNETVFLVRGKNGLKMFKVANFVCWIEKEIKEEDGTVFFLLKGKTKTGRDFEVEIDSEIMGSAIKLSGVLESVAGAMDGIAAGMSKHLSPAIKALTTTCYSVKRFHRVGWWHNHFLMPGRETEGIEQITSKLPFRIYLNGSDGTEALRNLIEALPVEKTTVALAFLLAAPMAKVVGWRNKRCALFIQGRFNSLKTAWASAAMSIYGDFVESDNLLRWGEGSTTVALAAHAIMASDMPLFVDNFKPQTGKGSAGFVNFIHAVLEGGEKERGDGKGHLRETRPIYSWPFFTGESVPDDDAATLTRIIVIEFAPQEVGLNIKLSRAQADSHSLPSIGHHWITWLESEEGQRVAIEVAAELPNERLRWASRISDEGSSVNALRVAQNLALLSLTWKTALRHPVLGPALESYTEQFEDGLGQTAKLLASATEESQESEKFLSVLSQLHETGRVKIVHTREAGPSIMDGDRMVGWYDSNGIYLLPNIAVSAVEKVLGWGGLNKISLRALYNQFESLGVLAPGSGNSTKTKALGGKVRRVIHLHPDTLKRYATKENIEEEVLPI